MYLYLYTNLLKNSTVFEKNLNFCELIFYCFRGAKSRGSIKIGKIQNGILGLLFIFNIKSWKNQHISNTIICTNTTILLSSQKRWIMLRNNIELDVKEKCIEGKTTRAEIAKEINI